MKHSMLLLLAAGMFVLAGSSELRAQEVAVDATADADAETATEAVEDILSDVQVVDASILSADGMEPTAMYVEFSGSGDALTAALTVPDMEGFRMEMTGLHISKQEFRFSFLEPGGTTINCELMRLEDDSFRGECDAGGIPVEMTIEAFNE